MKLLTKTTLWYVSLTLTLFAVGGLVFYFSLRNIIDENISENLEQTQEQILNYAKKTGKLPAQPTVGNDLLIFTPADSEIKTKFRDTVRYAESEEESLPYRELVFTVKTDDGIYTAIAGTPIIESDDLIESIVTSFGIVSGIVLVALFLLNLFLSKSLWNPFYKTLESLRKFDLSKKESMEFPPSTISEFKLLNEALNKMTQRILSDYQNLKEFTENASHELQTPLAIIRSKLELMIQSENLPEDQVKSVREIYESVNRLSKLNQSLLLLSKIENRQFDKIQTVDFRDLIANKLKQFEELIAFKNIRLSFPKPSQESSSIQVNPQLADILISNILSNAIRHNINEGEIIVELKNNSLAVSNSGNPLNTSPDKLFGRFQKAGTSPESVGLGLSIVKQICDTYGFGVEYSHREGMHSIAVKF